jgi:hypothetical protein
MVGAIDAVCDVAQRIIDKLTQGAGAGGPSLRDNTARATRFKASGAHHHIFV